MLLAAALALAAASGPRCVEIAAVSDLHGRVADLPLLAARVAEIRARGPTLLLDAGDGLQGTIEASLSRGEAPEMLRVRLSEAIAQAGTGCEAVLLMTDMFGGTPSNIGMTLLEPDRLELLAGVNLPMLLKFFNYRASHRLGALVVLLRDQARDAILVASELLPRED